MERRGYIKTLEAVLAIVILLIVTYTIIPKKIEPNPDVPLVVQDAQRFIVSDLTSNNSLRELVLTSPNYNSISSEVRAIINAHKPSAYDFTCAICPSTDACVQQTPLKKSVYMSDVFVASSLGSELGSQGPKIIRFWFWAKPTPSEDLVAGYVNTCELKGTLPPPDTEQPTISIDFPTSSPSYSTTASTINLAGSSFDNVGVTQVSWSNDRGGSGSASGSNPWKANSIALSNGNNVITVTASDASGNTATDVITVIVSGVAQQSTLTVSSGQGMPSDNVNIQVSLANTPGNSISGLNFNLPYDTSKLTFVSAVAGQTVTDAGKSLSYNEPTAGDLRFVISGTNQNVIADGTLVSMVFSIKPAAQPGDVPLALTNAAAASPQAQPVSLSLVSGKITITTSQDNPPQLSNGQPSSTLSAGTTQTTMSVTTNENANCKYSTTPNTPYATMANTFTNTGTTSHTTTVTGLQNGQTYSYYVRCQDTAGNANTNDYTITFSVGSASTGNAYYVSSAIGSDSNPGTQAQPWARAPGMVGCSGLCASTTIRSGDTIYLRSQDTWTASSGNRVLTTTTAGVTYDGGGYGTGTRARLQATGSLGEAVVNIYHSDTAFKNFEVDGNSRNNGGLYVNYPSPATSISNINIDNVVVHHVGGSDGWYYGLAVEPINGRSVSGITITNCKVYNTVHEGITLYPSWQNSGNYISNAVIRGCEVYNTGLTGEYSYGDGILVKDDVRGATIEFNYFHDNPLAGIQFESYSGLPVPTNIVIRNNIVSSNSMWGIYILNSAGGSITSDIYNNLFVNNGKSGASEGGAIVWNSFPYASSVFNVYGNTILSTNNQASSKYAVLVGSGASGSPTIRFKNNIVYTNNHIPIEDGRNWLAHNNNLIYRTSGSADTHVVRGGTSYNRAAVLTWEPTAQNTDPTFKNTANLPTGITGVYGVSMEPNTDGLSVQPGSPAIDSGASLGTLYNGAINLAGKSGGQTRPQGTAWDIGAYEYTG